MTTRREALLVLAALPLLPACGGGGGTDSGTGEGDTGGGGGSCGGIVDDNHGHSISVPRADVTAGTARTYDIQGSSGHSHELSISAAQFAILADVGMVIVTSANTNGHTHQVTINCT
jgi:hypothetical protein